MDFIKKQSIGFFMLIITMILSMISLIYYLINAKTAYFASAGVNKKIVILLVISIVANFAFILGSEIVKKKLYLDILPVVATVSLVLTLVTLLSDRVSDIATIMTFANNAQTMSDLSSAITAIVLCVLAIIFNMITSFFKIGKE